VPAQLRLDVATLGVVVARRDGADRAEGEDGDGAEDQDSLH